MGRSDAYLFITSNEAILIDCGDVDDAEEILTYLSEKGISKLYYLIFTHLDKKSIGGGASLINSIEISNIIEPNYIKVSEAYSLYTEALNGKSVNVQKLDKKISFNVSELSFDISPCEKSNYSDDNNYSSSISVTHKNNKFLFIGDAKAERISEIISTTDPHDFLMMPDNGMFDEKLAALLDDILPKYAAITCSEKNPASTDVLELLSNRGINYYLTANGSIKITSDGNQIIIEQ
jgi:beta-lactamase superfamily II metal-dependent hydrolase